MAYTGNSIVDYLNSLGQASDYNSRAKLAAQKGITNYTGSADQNLSLLNTLRTAPTSSTPTYNNVPAAVQRQNALENSLKNTSVSSTPSPVTVASSGTINPNETYTPPVLQNIDANFYKTYQSQINEKYDPVALYNKAVTDAMGKYSSTPSKTELFSGYSFVGTDGAKYSLDAEGRPVKTSASTTTSSNNPTISLLQQQIKDLVTKNGGTEEQANQIIAQGATGVAEVNSILGGSSTSSDSGNVLSAEQLKNLSASFKTGSVNTSSVSSQDFMNSILPLLSQNTSNNSQLINSYTQNQQNYNQALSSEETAKGVDTYTKNIQDWTNQLATLKGQYDQQNLMLADQAIPMPTIVGQQNMLAQQTNAKMGTLATLIQAAQGNLNLAQEMAKKTVDAKYGSQEQQLTNLQLMLQSNQAEMSRADAKTAQILSLALNLRQETLAAEKEKDTQILSIASQMAAAGASQDVVSVITSSKTPAEALKLAAASGVLGKSDLLAGMSAPQIQQMNQITNDYETASKTYYAMRESYNKVVASSKLKTAGGDIALVYGFMKLNDPTSSVREGEYATAQNAGSMPEQVRSIYNKAVNGELLADSIRQSFVNAAYGVFSNAKAQQQVIANEYSQRAEVFGIPGELVIRGLSEIKSATPTPVGQTDMSKVLDSTLSKLLNVAKK
jgi:hypothetical protein